MEPLIPSESDKFFFDLNGYLILRNCASPELLNSLNSKIDELPDVPFGGWIGNSQRRDYNVHTGLEMHNAIELGKPFQTLIDHPAWINYLRLFCGENDSYVQGLFIDESILSVRKSGGHHPVHSGGYKAAIRGMYRYEHGVFRCGQVNIILALTDVQEGDGPTMVIPGSHKSNFPHPGAGDYGAGDRMDTLEGAIPAYLNKGDALLFVDGVMHGGSSRLNGGERRVTIYRYGPVWGASRFGYAYSAETLNAVTDAQRKILQPVIPQPTGSVIVKQY